MVAAFDSGYELVSPAPGARWRPLHNCMAAFRRNPAFSSIVAVLLIVLVPLHWMSPGFEAFRWPQQVISDADDHYAMFNLPDGTPQTPETGRYTDRMLNLNTSDPLSINYVDTSGLRFALFIPTYHAHIPLLLTFLQSVKCLCTDHTEIDFHVITSNSMEVRQFQDGLQALPACGSKYGRWDVPQSNVDGPDLRIITHNLFDILPTSLVNMTRGTLTADDTSALLKERDRFEYAAIKKLVPAIQFDYDWGLWLDSEAIVVRPFSLRDTFTHFIRHPTIFHSRMASNGDMRWRMSSAAKTLGRDIASFGDRYWTLESVNWFVEKAVMSDLVRYSEDAHGDEFWRVWTKCGAPFEILLYNMHIHSRKLELTDSIFSKYAVLEVEREMIRFGMAPAFPEMENRSGTGFLERGWLLLKHAAIQRNFSAFLNRHGQRLFRMEDLGIAPREVIDRFLLETPIDMLVCGQPPLYDWWKSWLDEETT